MDLEHVEKLCQVLEFLRYVISGNLAANGLGACGKTLSYLNFSGMWKNFCQVLEFLRAAGSSICEGSLCICQGNPSAGMISRMGGLEDRCRQSLCSEDSRCSTCSHQLPSFLLGNRCSK